MFGRLKCFYDSFVGNGQKLFWFFMAVNLIPSLLLLFTEPYSWVGKLVLISFPLGMYLVVFCLLRNVGLLQLLLIPQLVLNAFQIVLFYLFGESVIAVDMFLNLATTNVTEANELLSNLWPAIIAVCVIYVPTIVVAGVGCRRRTHPEGKFRRRMATWGAGIVLLSYGLSFVATGRNGARYELKNNVFPVNVYYNLGFAVDKWDRSMRYPETSKEFRFGARKEMNAEKREVYVLVVGEAGRACNWSLLGYERETNPLLSKRNGLVLFGDAITQANATHKSVPLILSGASADHFEVIYEQKSILTAFKEAGFTTVFVSNQTPNRTFTDFFAAEADHHVNIRPASSGGVITKNRYDMEMLPLLEHFMDSVVGNLFMVVHCYGSHFNYYERYPEEFSFFQPDAATEVEVKNRTALVNAYDNSVRYTDCFLDSLMGMLEGSGACATLYYSSDHGEDLLDDRRRRFLHASPHPTYYQLHIPLFLWFSEDYRGLFPEKYEEAVRNCRKPVSTRIAFHTMLDVAFIETPWRDSTFSVVNPYFKARKRSYLTDHDEPIFWQDSGLKEEDREMIKRKGMGW